MTAIEEAGRELDALIAEKVMGWTTFISDYGIETDYYADPSKPSRTGAGEGKSANAGWQRPDGCIKPFNPSKSMEAAGVVLEKLHSNYYDIQITNDCEGHTVDAWYVTLTGDIKTAAPTLPHAICLAALGTVEQ